MSEADDLDNRERRLAALPDEWKGLAQVFESLIRVSPYGSEERDAMRGAVLDALLDLHGRVT